jgi:hypothetical protein
MVAFAPLLDWVVKAVWHQGEVRGSQWVAFVGWVNAHVLKNVQVMPNTSNGATMGGGGKINGVTCGPLTSWGVTVAG